jgi:glutamine synthetase
VGHLFCIHMNPAEWSVHGYSMLRTSLNMDYYHDLYDLATDFGVEVEAHRKSLLNVG